MAHIDDTTIPYASLALEGDAAASVLAGEALAPEVIASLLMRVVRGHASAVSGASVEPVSVTVDVTGSVEPGETIDIRAAIDRKTRTIVFAGGEATVGSRPLLHATAVYRIV